MELFSHHVMSCHVMSCHVMSCHVMSCHITSQILMMTDLLSMQCLVAWNCLVLRHYQVLQQPLEQWWPCLGSIYCTILIRSTLSDRSALINKYCIFSYLVLLIGSICYMWLLCEALRSCPLTSDGAVCIQEVHTQSMGINQFYTGLVKSGASHVNTH